MQQRIQNSNIEGKFSSRCSIYFFNIDLDDLNNLIFVDLFFYFSTRISFSIFALYRIIFLMIHATVIK